MIDDSGCFECGATEDIHQHHVVPRLRGGAKTIPLCYRCHLKAHGQDGKGLNHSLLVKQGMERAKKRGVNLGNASAEFRMKGHAANRKRGLQTVRKYGPMLSKLQKEGRTMQEVAVFLNKTFVPTPSGKGVWDSPRVCRLLKRWKQQKTS